MRAQVKTFNGHTLWDSSYQAAVLNIGTMPGAKPVYIEQTNADAGYAGVFTRDVRSVALSVKILNYANRESLRAQLAAWFKPGTSGNLVATFDVDDLDYQLPCVVQSGPISEGSERYTIILQSEASAWRAVTADNASAWNVTGTSGTKSITVEGDDETRLSVTFTPSVNTPANFKYQRLYTLVPPNGIHFGLRPWCITLDTAALVTAGKLQADCDDLRIWLDDVETRRWINGPNTTTTKIWFNVDLKTGVRLLNLRVAVTDVETVTHLRFEKTPTNAARMRRMPAEGIVYHGTEWFYYTKVDLVGYFLRIQERGIYDTTQQAHSVGDDFDFLPAAIRVVYGKASATAPSTNDENYDNTKPLFSLSSSDNTSWVWTATDKFYDPDNPARPGGWVRGVARLGDVSKAYWIKADAESGDAAAGMTIGSWLKGSVWQNERAIIRWSFEDATGMQTITVTGRKYRSTARWPFTLAAIQRSPDGATWYTVFNEATPGSVSTWTALTNDSTPQSIANTTKKVRAVFSRYFSALANAYAMFEILTCTIAFTTANIPPGSLASEVTNYALTVTLTNNTTGESMDLDLPMQMNKSLVLNGEDFTATYKGANSHHVVSLDDEGRAVWLRLVKGSNAMAISGADDVGTLGVALSWYRRRL